MPDSVRLVFAKPRGFEQLSAQAFAALVLERVRQVEEAAAVERSRRGTHVLGRKGVLDQRWSDRPVSREPRRQLSPRVAARSKWSRIEAILRNKAFREAYLQARALFIKGTRDVLFPAGTYWLRRFARAVCVASPS